MKARTRIILTHILAGCLAAQLGFMLSFQPICDDETFHHSWQAAWKGSNKPRQPQIDWILSGAAKVATEDVIDSLQMGFPLHGFTNKGKLGDNHKSSLLLYNPSTLAKPLAGWQKNHTRLNLPTLYWTLATARCAEMKHLLLTADSRGRHTKTCLAIVAQRESYYINKWIRDGSLEKPFQFASRFDFPSDHTCFSKNVPSKEQIDASSEVLVPYLTHLDAALQRLKPLADQVANAGQNPSTKGTIIVMVCNFGHAELFINYICAARAVGMDTSQILLFATDEETYDIARGLGIAAFHDEKIFESIPKTASAIYGDRQYGKIMMSKVYCVHLVVELGHSVFFQDVDIIPYRSDYLVYFVTKLAPPEYDLTFQMDHNLRQEYQPWIANSGCYYVRNNAKTRHFFASFVVRGDAMILAVRSHQASMHSLLSEHASRFNLRIKSLQEEHAMVPLGWHYHRDKEFMKDMIRKNKTEPLSFHMNWNKDKQQKRDLLEQMGDWYVTKRCIGERTAAMMLQGLPGQYLSKVCCYEKPFARCHFRDLPSVIPCRKSPEFNKGADKPSFW